MSIGNIGHSIVVHPSKEEIDGVSTFYTNTLHFTIEFHIMTITYKIISLNEVKYE